MLTITHDATGMYKPMDRHTKNRFKFCWQLVKSQWQNITHGKTWFLRPSSPLPSSGYQLWLMLAHLAMQTLDNTHGLAIHALKMFSLLEIKIKVGGIKQSSTNEIIRHFQSCYCYGFMQQVLLDNLGKGETAQQLQGTVKLIIISQLSSSPLSPRVCYSCC